MSREPTKIAALPDGWKAYHFNCNYMSYGEKRRYQLFIVKYQINYPSGKKWTNVCECYAYSEIGAKDIIMWLKKGKNICILSITPTGVFSEASTYPDNHCVGDR